MFSAYSKVLLLLLTSPLTIVLSQDHEGDCPVEEFINMGYKKAYSTQCFVHLTSSGDSESFMDTDYSDVIWTALGTAITDANEEGDDSFPLVVAEMEPGEESQSFSREEEDRRSLYWARFVYRGSGLCRLCFWDNKDYRAALRTRRQLDSDILDILGQDKHISSRLQRQLEETNLELFQEIDCVAVTCDGSDFVDYSGNGCDGVSFNDETKSFELEEHEEAHDDWFWSRRI